LLASPSIDLRQPFHRAINRSSLPCRLILEASFGIPNSFPVTSLASNKTSPPREFGRCNQGTCGSWGRGTVRGIGGADRGGDLHSCRAGDPRSGAGGPAVTGPDKARRATIRAMARLWQFETNSPPIQADPNWTDTPLGERCSRDEALAKWRGGKGDAE
jgi:hypothetical protein